MNRAYRTNRIRHYGRSPSREISERRVTNSANNTLRSAVGRYPEYVDRVRGETEEVGLTLVPPPRYRSLLVPVDGEAFGEHALPLALGIARQAGAEVRVVHVHCPLQSTF